MIVVRRTFYFCSIFAKNIDGDYMLEAILRVQILYVSSKYNVGSQIQISQKRNVRVRTNAIMTYF